MTYACPGRNVKTPGLFPPVKYHYVGILDQLPVIASGRDYIRVVYGVNDGLEGVGEGIGRVDKLYVQDSPSWPRIWPASGCRGL